MSFAAVAAAATTAATATTATAPTLPVAASDAARERVDAVHAAQRARGMEPRGDSRLTQLFADGVADAVYASADDVAHELCVVDHIFRTTLYGEIIEDVMRRVAHELREATGRRLSWPDTWQVVRAHVPTLLKLHSLRWSGQLAHVSAPAAFPWLGAQW